MPKLTPGSGPIDRRDDPRDSGARHESWVRRFFAQHHPNEEPRACDCGFWSDPWLVSCTERDRVRCRKTAEVRLEQYHRRAHERALGAKREFPRLPKAAPRQCLWCRQVITLGRADRTMHDGRGDEPRCRQVFNLHKDLDAQRAYLVERDGLGCVGCGHVAGRWARFWRCDAARAPEHGYDGETSVIVWRTALEVDHRIALALAWEAFSGDERRRWFFGPANLRLLCSACHKAKTAEDRRLISDAYSLGPEWAKAEVLRRLKDAGLIASARPKGA